MHTIVAYQIGTKHQFRKTSSKFADFVGTWKLGFTMESYVRPAALHVEVAAPTPDTLCFLVFTIAQYE